MMGRSDHPYVPAALPLEKAPSPTLYKTTLARERSVEILEDKFIFRAENRTVIPHTASP